MTEIIPYYSELGPHNGAFIRPDGKILLINDNKHEEFAERYCNGRDYNILTGSVFGPATSAQSLLEAQRELEEAKKGVDIFRTSRLTKSQLLRYKKWLEKYKIDNKSLYADFLVFVLSYDKVETRISNLITTTALEPHVRFYNYYLMDWTINPQKPLIYDAKEDFFHLQEDQIPISDYADREAEEEIEEIKAKVLLKDRPYFFK